MLKQAYEQAYLGLLAWATIALLMAISASSVMSMYNV